MCGVILGGEFMNDIKLTIAKASVHMLDNCVAKFGVYRFDAINVPLLLEEVVATDKSFLKEYLMQEGADQMDLDAYLPGYCDDRKRELLIKEGEDYDDLTQEEAAEKMPNFHIPDSEYDEMEQEESDELDEDDEEDYFDVANDSIFEGDYEVEGEDEANDILEPEEGLDEDETTAEESYDSNKEKTSEEEKPCEENDQASGKDVTITEVKSESDGTQYIVMTVKDKSITSLEVFTTDPTKYHEKKSVSKPKPKKPQYKSEHISDCVFLEENGRRHYYPASNEFMKIVTTIADMSKEYGFTEVKPVHFTMALFKIDNIVVQEFMKDLELSYSEAKKFFTGWSLLNNGMIPFDLQGFVYCLNDKIDVSKPCEVLMRDEEVKRIWNICHKKTKRNTILVGEAGVGKTAIIEKLTYEIVSGKCPKKFRGFQVLVLDVNSLIAGTMYRGDSEERAKNLVDFLQSQNNVILFIDEVHTILGAGACDDDDMDLADALKPILARGEAVVIGATTEKEYKEHFVKDSALSRRFEKVVVEEPESHEVYPMIVNKIKSLSDFHNVRISRQMVEYAIMISHCFNSDKRNPDRTLDAIDKSMVSAELSGRKKVTKKDVLSTYGVSFKRFAKMSQEAKLEIAYHEMGHYVFAKLSEYLIDERLLAVSIMPIFQEDFYLGITCYEYRKDIIPHANLKYYIDVLARSLAGRVSEKMYTNDITDGARKDLEHATEYAHALVSKSGMTVSGEERNYVFLNTVEQPMYSEDTINQLNQEVKKLTDMAYKRAEEVIHGHKDLVEMLVSAIMEEHIMSEAQLDVIWKQYFKNHKE